MNEKLDPRLEEILESDDHIDQVDVLVGLRVPIDDEIRTDLVSRGLTPRSEIGTVLTGSIARADVQRLAESAHVTKIEAGAPLFPESTPQALDPDG